MYKLNFLTYSETDFTPAFALPQLMNTYSTFPDLLPFALLQTGSYTVHCIFSHPCLCLMSINVNYYQGNIMILDPANGAGKCTSFVIPKSHSHPQPYILNPLI